MTNVNKNSQFRRPQLQVASYNHTPGKGLIVVSVGKLEVGKFTYDLNKFNTPEKEKELIEKIAFGYKADIENGEINASQNPISKTA